MRTLLLFTSLLVSTLAYGQALPSAPCDTTLSRIREYFFIKDTIGGKQGQIRSAPRATTVASNYLLSKRTLNEFAAKKQAYYLSGSSDLSLYENFAISNVTDGKLQVGHNFAFHLPNNQINSLLTIAAQSNIANNFANIFSKRKLANDLGLNLKFTNLLGTKTFIHSTNAEQTAMDHTRKLYLQKLLIRNREQIRLQSLYGTDPELAAARLVECEEQAKQAESDFYDHELSEIEKSNPGHGYSKFRTRWWSIQAFMPVTTSTYQVAADTLSMFREEEQRNWSLTFNYGWLRETKGGTFFHNIRGKVFNNNSIGSKNPGMMQFNQYVFKSGASNSSLSDDATTVYIGPYEKFYTSVLQGQVVWFAPTKTDSKAGLSFLAEQNFGKYNALNMQLGIPIFLKGKDKDSGVNVELQFKWADFSNSVNSTLTRADKFTTGLSVSLPFGSIIY